MDDSPEQDVLETMTRRLQMQVDDLAYSSRVQREESGQYETKLVLSGMITAFELVLYVMRTEEVLMQKCKVYRNEKRPTQKN